MINTEIESCKSKLITSVLGIDPDSNPDERKINVELRLLNIKEVINNSLDLAMALAQNAQDNHVVFDATDTIQAIKDDWQGSLEYLESDFADLEWGE